MQVGQVSKAQGSKRKRWNQIHAANSFKSRLGHPERLQRWKADQVKLGKFSLETAVKVPLILDPATAWESFIEFINKINDLARNKRTNIFLEFRECQAISIDGALVLLAEMKRCNQCAGIFFKGNYPVTAQPFTTLRDLKFFEQITLNKRPSWYEDKKPPEGIEILEIATGNNSKPQEVDKTIQKLVYGNYDSTRETSEFSRLAYRALSEAMANVIDHAYPPDIEKVWIRGQWWMSGYKNTLTGELVFIFYDQGVGIPATIPVKWDSSFKALVGLLGYVPSDSQLIEIATKLGESRTDEANRGKGLQDLKMIIDQNDTVGALEITSGRGGYIYRGKDRPSELMNYKNALDGTLIIWNVKPTVGVRVNE